MTRKKKAVKPKRRLPPRDKLGRFIKRVVKVERTRRKIARRLSKSRRERFEEEYDDVMAYDAGTEFELTAVTEGGTPER